MTNAYCTLDDVKNAMSGDGPAISAQHDVSIAKRIIEVSADIDRKIALCRGEAMSEWSFVAAREYGRQIIYLSSAPPATSGVFSLSFNGDATGDITYAAEAADVLSSLENLGSVGSGNLEVAGDAGGPWTVTFAGALNGPQPLITGIAATNPGRGSVVVLPMVVGSVMAFTTRRFDATTALYAKLLLIDDCVEIAGVTLDGSGLVDPTDYRPWPSRGLPHQALKRTALGDWPEWPSEIEVTARWGYADEVPADVRETAVIEVIRGHLAANAGNDDRLGTTPFGSVITAKAFTSKFRELVNDRGNKLW